MRTALAKSVIITAMILVFVAVHWLINNEPEEWSAALVGSWREGVMGLLLFSLGYFWRGVSHEFNHQV